MAFLEGRLEEQKTVEWALTLEPEAIVERTAVLELLSYPPRRPNTEPWHTAWALIDGLPRTSSAEASRGEEYQISQRVRAGDRSTTLVATVHIPCLQVAALAGMLGRDDPFRAAAMRSRP